MFDNSEDALVDQCCRDQHYSTDRISMLPDELLVCILSLLTLKESVATSLLSRRWRYSWTLMPTLYFDAESSLFKVEMTENKKLVTDEETMTKYVRWVDHVLALHKCYAIEDFRVYFGLTKPYERYIDSWVNYALARKVKRLELNLTCRCDLFFHRSSVDCYTFPYKFLRQYKENCSNESQSHGMRQCNPIHFKYLEKISMTQVNVNGEALEFFLSNCPLLQHLSVSKSRELSTLKIIGPFPSFKYLEIISCHNLKSFEICDANLVYLKYVGNSIHQFFLKNVPLLVEVFISGLIEMRDVLSMFSSVLPQLEKFNFQLGFWLCWEVIMTKMVFLYCSESINQVVAFLDPF